MSGDVKAWIVSLGPGAQVGNYRPATNLPAGDGQWGRGEQFTPVIIAESLQESLVVRAGCNKHKGAKHEGPICTDFSSLYWGLGQCGRIIQDEWSMANRGHEYSIVFHGYCTAQRHT